MGGCLKCGKETAQKAVFCQACTDVMAQYPVKPDSVIHLPLRQPPQEKKPVCYTENPQAEHIRNLRKLIRWLTAIVAALSILLVLMAGLLLHTLEKNQDIHTIGKNYTTDTRQQP